MARSSSTPSGDDATTTLFDADHAGPGCGAELFIVEGVSAARAVARVRHRRFQAVIAMQGKPLNAAHAQSATLLANPHIAHLLATLGTGWAEECNEARCRYDRVILLCDADADGIHTRALLLLLIERGFLPLLDAGRVFAARAPLYAVSAATDPKGPGGTAVSNDPHPNQEQYCFTEVQRDRVLQDLDAAGRGPGQFRRFKGIASMDPDQLFSTCVDPASRFTTVLTRDHGDAARASFLALRRSGLSMRRDGR
jgi:DNA gyrase/topoisomerase IV subunit B